MENKIPFFSLQRQWETNKSKINNALNEILESQQFVGGEFIQKFESKLASYLNVKYVKTCNSGTDALWLALKAINLKKNDIVLTTPFSFIASSSEISAHDGHPVFIDIEEDTFNISPIAIKKWLETYAKMQNNVAIHTETGYPVKGILVVNIFGQLANYDAIQAIAKAWNLWIIEDACQSIGSELNGKMAGNFGDIATFSFYPTKNLGAFGDAGCLTTNNDELASRIQMLRNHGRYEKYDYVEYGINSRMDTMQAAILGVKLDSIDQLNEQRRSIAQQYRKQLSNLSFLKLPIEKVGKHTYHQFSVQIISSTTINRDMLIEYLNKNNIGYNIFYPMALNQIKFLQTDSRLISACPVAENATQNILALPIWPELTEEEVNYICTTLQIFGTNTLNKNITISRPI